MKKIYLIALFLLCSFVHMQGQKFQVAVLEPTATSGTTAIEKAMIRGELIKQLSRHPNYAAFSRMDIDQIMSEQNFQRTGMVNDASIKKIGELQGVDFIAVSKITKEGNTFYLEAYLVNIESGQFHSPATEYGVLSGGYENMLNACAGLAQAMVGQVSNMPNRSTYSSSSSSLHNGAAYNPDGIELIYVEGTGSGILAMKGFYIGKYEITQAQWRAVMGTNPSNFKGDNRPVEMVSWNDVQEFLRKLNQMTGRNYALPTEAQWEYTARGGKNNDPYEYAGSNSLDGVAWYDGNSGQCTHAVGTKSPNSIGIYDMSGNVWEWCQDWYDSSQSYRVARGGSWYGSASYCRVSGRGNYSPGSRYDDLGFRVVLVP